MSKTLGKIERIVLFCGFLVILAGLVGVAYLVTGQSPRTAAAMEPSAAFTPAAAPTTALPPQIVFASDEPEPFNGDDWSWQAWPSSSRKSEIDQSEIQSPVLGADVKQALAATAPPRPTNETSPIPSYAMNVPEGRVIHMYTGEGSDTSCWYELKLDPPQLDALRASAIKLAQTKGMEIDELDHLAELPPKADEAMRWWRPGDITDVNLLNLAGTQEDRMWIAMSRRTGRVFIFASRPVGFSSM